jgi:hypothetical protein
LMPTQNESNFNELLTAINRFTASMQVTTCNLSQSLGRWSQPAAGESRELAAVLALLIPEC